MATSSASNRLGQWLSEAYSVVSNIKSIATASAAADPASNPAAATPTNQGGNSQSNTSPPSPSGSDPSTPSASAGSSPTQATAPVSAAPASSPTSSARISSTNHQSGTSTSSTGSTPATTSTTLSQAASSSSSHSVAAASSTAAPAAQPHHHNNHTLAIILGVVFGLLAVALLALCLFCCLRRRRRRNKRVVSPDDDEIDSWRGPDHTQPMMSNVPPTGQYSYLISGAPNHSQHPAYRGMETGSTNPFVPIVPPPRRGGRIEKDSLSPTKAELPADSSNSNTTGSTPNSNSNIPAHTRNGKLSDVEKGVAAAAVGGVAGAAANRIGRKPVGSGASVRSRDSSASGAISPVDNPNRVSASEYNGQSPVSPVGIGQGFGRSPFDNGYASANQPLMSGSEVQGSEGLPRRYSPARPATPLGFASLGAAGAAGAAAATAAHNHKDSSYLHSSSDSGNFSRESGNFSRESSESASRIPPPEPVSAAPPRQHSITPPNAASQSPRRARFSDPVAVAGAAAPRDGSRSSRSGSSSESILRSANPPARPSNLRHSTDSSSESRTESGDSTWRLSSSMPGGFGPAQPPSSSRAGNTSPSRPRPTPHPGGKRLRLSDLMAEEEERQRLRSPSYNDYYDDSRIAEEDNNGWVDHGSGRGGHGNGNGNGNGNGQRRSDLRQYRHHQERRPSYDGYGYGGYDEDEEDDGGHYGVGMAM